MVVLVLKSLSELHAINQIRLNIQRNEWKAVCALYCE